MTTLTGQYVWGPASMPGVPYNHTGYNTYALDDSNDAVRTRFLVPKDGTLSKIGVYVETVTGNPPAYQAVFKDTAGSAYGGCSAESIDFTVTGWQWVTLASPATANAGDLIDAVLEPTGSAPDASNCVTVRVSLGLADAITYPQGSYYSTSWTAESLLTVGVAYSDGSIAVPGLSSMALSIDTGTTPDEAGALFTLPFACKCIGAIFGIAPDNTFGDFGVSLLNAANNVLGTTGSWDISASGQSSAGLYVGRWDEVSLSASTNYRLIVTPSTTTNVGVGVAFCESANSAAYWPEYGRWTLTQRADSGAWSETALTVPLMALILSEITLPEASGGGGGSWAGGMVIG